MSARPLYTPSRTRHTPRIVITRQGPAVMLNGEPLCGAEGGPGSTTCVDSMVTCCECTKLLSEGGGKR